MQVFSPFHCDDTMMYIISFLSHSDALHLVYTRKYWVQHYIHFCLDMQTLFTKCRITNTREYNTYSVHTRKLLWVICIIQNSPMLTRKYVYSLFGTHKQFVSTCTRFVLCTNDVQHINVFRNRLWSVAHQCAPINSLLEKPPKMLLRRIIPVGLVGELCKVLKKAIDDKALSKRVLYSKIIKLAQYIEYTPRVNIMKCSKKLYKATDLWVRLFLSKLTPYTPTIPGMVGGKRYPLYYLKNRFTIWKYITKKQPKNAKMITLLLSHDFEHKTFASTVSYWKNNLTYNNEILSNH